MLNYSYFLMVSIILFLFVLVPLFVPIEVYYEELTFFGLINHLDSNSNYSDENLLICALKNQLIELNRQYADCSLPEKEFKAKKKQLKEKFEHLKVCFQESFFKKDFCS